MAKILIVDDSDILRMELADVLLAGGHTVVEGQNGRIGLEQATTHADLDLIITDLNMPEMDGVVMCRGVRALATHAKTPIFMLTTESSTDLKAEGKAVGIMLWIVKPFNGDRVLAAISKVLSMKAA